MHPSNAETWIKKFDSGLKVFVVGPMVRESPPAKYCQKKRLCNQLWLTNKLLGCLHRSHEPLDTENRFLLLFVFVYDSHLHMVSAYISCGLEFRAKLVTR